MTDPMVNPLSPTTPVDLDERAVAAARAIPLIVVQDKGHGHAGTAMALAPVSHVLFQRVMRHDPSAPEWPGRDRFILSAGHASLLLYTQLYLTGYGLELAEIAAARSFGSRTPGHPERGHTPGVDMSTGPLGQGIASAVGLAAALAHKRALLDGDTAEPLYDSTVWVIAGDGCLQEGVSSEASSLAGTLALDNLVVIWDDNGITIDGDDALNFREDTRARYRAYGWNVLDIQDVNDLDHIESVLLQAKEADRPTLVAYPSVIGYPSPGRSGTSAAHAGAFGADEVSATLEHLGFPAAVPLEDVVDHDLLAHTRRGLGAGKAAREAWEARRAQRLADDPQLAALDDQAHNRALALRALDAWDPASLRSPQATRTTSGAILSALHDLLPLWGGSADLSGSTSVALPGVAFSAEHPEGNFWAFGIREHAMAAILSGIALEGTWRPYGSTYLAFSDYSRPALRLSSLMELPVIHIYTHDSVAVGEDGPTHQPVEQIASLRTVPGVAVIRPADGTETLAAWRRLVATPEGPAALILSRQELPSLESSASHSGTERGGYVVQQWGRGDDIALIATGSEASLALTVARQLADRGYAPRVVSMPCVEWFDAQPRDYREEVLPPGLSRRLVVEAGASAAWWKYAGAQGKVIGIDQFGTSGPGPMILDHLGISVPHVLAEALELLDS